MHRCLCCLLDLVIGMGSPEGWEMFLTFFQNDNCRSLSTECCHLRPLDSDLLKLGVYGVAVGGSNLGTFSDVVLRAAGEAQVHYLINLGGSSHMVIRIMSAAFS